jgi:hypothetical protein
MYSRSNHQKDKTAENGRIRRMALFMLVEPKEHQDGHAPHATVLDGSVELGRFLLQEASHE